MFFFCVTGENKIQERLPVLLADQLKRFFPRNTGNFPANRKRRSRRAKNISAGGRIAMPIACMQTTARNQRAVLKYFDAKCPYIAANTPDAHSLLC